MATIVLTGGGTAGHVMPHLALLPYLKQDFDNIYYIGSEFGMEKEIIAKTGLKYYSVPCTKLIRKFTLKNFAIPFILYKGVRQAGKILDELKPDVIFSKGGYVSLPVVIAAKKRKIPVIAHESDYTVGLANRISAKYCDKVLTSFPSAAKTLKNGVHIGAPLKNSLYSVNKAESLKFFGLSGKKPVILITGGSLGSAAINSATRNALNNLLPDFDILHVSGKGNLSGIKKTGYVEIEFTDKMERAFACAAVCVSRAGANTVFEMASLKLPMLLIPLPKTVSRGDQILNAEYFKNLGLARVLHQENLTNETLSDSVRALYSDRQKLADAFNAHPIENAAYKISQILGKYKR
ncbi:MAG: undecaprenyldiphospho-muramoylpentapeptide beta-N-acetylglucosaminyltransferase [Clostridia bacterium]|nr:undecaprenyldiphospho-muramoylpentapeptide beta-N-acetylglucosaminyltransferase [Clostridia bacterium]